MKLKYKKRGRKKGQNLIICSGNLNEYKKEDCILVQSKSEPFYNTYVSKIWWSANKNKSNCIWSNIN